MVHFRIDFEEHDLSVSIEAHKIEKRPVVVIAELLGKSSKRVRLKMMRLGLVVVVDQVNFQRSTTTTLLAFLSMDNSGSSFILRNRNYERQGSI
jgi:hypothetical protein